MVWRQIKAIVLMPGMVTGVIPALIWWLFGRGAGMADLPAGITAVAIGAGILVLAFGLALFVWTVVLFARRGKGTLSPLDAPTKLVVDGPYRHVRNPMYAAVFSILIGEALILRSWPILVWLVCAVTFVSVFVPRKEERWLSDQFGEQYAAYRAHVPRWVPRLTPWTGSA